MHEAAAPLQVGLNVVGTLGITGAVFAAGNLLGRRIRRARGVRTEPAAPPPRGHEAPEATGSLALRAPAQTVSDNPAERRFEIHVDNELVGVAEYARSDDVITFNHTEISPRYRGRGLSGTLIEFALDASRSAGLSVDARCPYVLTFIGKHGEYSDMLTLAVDPSEESEGCCVLQS